MSKYHNMGIWISGWIRVYYVLCSKPDNTFGGHVLVPPLVPDGPLGASICETFLLQYRALITHNLFTSLWSSGTIWRHRSGSKSRRHEPLLTNHRWGLVRFFILRQYYKEYSGYLSITLLLYSSFYGAYFNVITVSHLKSVKTMDFIRFPAK